MHIYRIIECFTSIIYMFISICGKPVFYGQLAEHLVQLCEPCYTCKLKITSNGKECSRQVPFSVQTSTYSNVFFCNIQLNLSDFPYLLTKRNKKQKTKKTKNRFAVLFSRSSKRAITDQILSELEEMLSILLGFRKHVRYVACMRA